MNINMRKSRVGCHYKSEVNSQRWQNMAFQRNFAFFDRRVTTTPTSDDTVSLLKVKLICCDGFSQQSERRKNELTLDRNVLPMHHCTKLDQISAGPTMILVTPVHRHV